MNPITPDTLLSVLYELVGKFWGRLLIRIVVAVALPVAALWAFHFASRQIVGMVELSKSFSLEGAHPGLISLIGLTFLASILVLTYVYMIGGAVQTVMAVRRGEPLGDSTRERRETIDVLRKLLESETLPLPDRETLEAQLKYLERPRGLKRLLLRLRGKG